MIFLERVVFWRYQISDINVAVVHVDLDFWISQNCQIAKIALQDKYLVN